MGTPAGTGAHRVSEQALRRRHEQILFTRYQRHGDMHAREELVQRFLPLARRLARRCERSILYLRFAEGLTQVEMAERIGISQMHVSRLIRRALERLRLAAGAGAAGQPVG